MSAFNLQWSPANTNTLATERYAHLYAFVVHGEIAFIGSAYREDLAVHLATSLQQLELDASQTNIFLGRLREVGSGRISEQVVDTLLSLLVYAKKPKMNRVGKYRYLGTMDMQLSNAGLDHLPARLRTQGNVVIVQGSGAGVEKPALVAGR